MVASDALPPAPNVGKVKVKIRVRRIPRLFITSPFKLNANRLKTNRNKSEKGPNNPTEVLGKTITHDGWSIGGLSMAPDCRIEQCGQYS